MDREQEALALFHETYPPDPGRIDVSMSKLDGELSNAPQLYRTELKTEGFGSYGEGVLWAMDPSIPMFDSDDWSEISVGEEAIVLFMTAFGSLFLWDAGSVKFLNLYSRKLTTAGSNLVTFMAITLPGSEYREVVIQEREAKSAVAQLGPLEIGQCFGYSPLPSMGGSFDPASIVKVSAPEYISIAGQMG